jgi:BTB And C-terminal Kelch
MHTLQILELGSRFQCHDLEILCVKELDMFLSVDYVIPVYRALRCYNCVQAPRKAKDEKGRDKKKKAKEVTLHSPEEYFAALLQNCLQLIEMQAETVFENPEMLKLRFEELEIVVRREALQMSSETVIFDLLAKWSNEECRRKNLEITAENRRRVLGGLCFVPRYLSMSQRDFEVARDRVELLDPVEMKLVRDVLNGKKPQNVTPEQTRMLAAFKEPRPPFPLLPIYLSDRSNPKHYPKKMRKATEAIENGEVERGCCSKLGMGCATFFACIFD